MLLENSKINTIYCQSLFEFINCHL